MHLHIPKAREVELEPQHERGQSHGFIAIF